MSPLGDDEKASIPQTIDEEVLEGADISYRRAPSSADGGFDIDGELDLFGVRAPIRFALRSTMTTSRDRLGQADRLGAQALLGVVRHPQGRRRVEVAIDATPQGAHQMVELDHTFSTGKPPTTTGTRSSTSIGSSRASRAAR